MSKISAIFCAIACIVCNAYAVNAQHAIIPRPVSYTSSTEAFIVPDSIGVFAASPQLSDVFSVVNSDQNGLFTQMDDSNAASVVLQLGHVYDERVGEEGYTLEVQTEQINVLANTKSGIFNGLQTLSQMIRTSEGKLQTCKIEDYPQFAWRGLMLDVSRHFFNVEEVKSFISKMSAYKFNVFHWHLTDDQGWRIEIKSLPKLTEVGAWRVERYGKFGKDRSVPKPNEPATYGGFYTQEEIKEVVSFAAERNITIVPEIDVPGHSMALLAAYPHLSTRKEPKYVVPGSKFSEWYGDGTFKMLIENTLDPSNEEVYETMDKILGEVAQLFPGDYIHIGGDEAYKGYWEEDQGCLDFMEANQLESSDELQAYFINRMEKIISGKGKKMIGWDEILEGDLTKEAAIMNWRGWKNQGVKASREGYKVVMSPTHHCYLDYTQGDRSIEIPIYANLSLAEAYRFNPIPDGANPEMIMGGQGNLWTESVPTLRHAYYMTYPRAMAISESLWSSPASKQYEHFLQRVEKHFQMFDAQNTPISKAIYDPIVKVIKQGTRLEVRMSHDFGDAEIYYTMDGTFPDQYSLRYEGPFYLPEGNITLNVQAVRQDQKSGRMIHLLREQLENRAE